MWLMFNRIADDVPSEPHTNQTVVSLLDHFRPPAASPAAVPCQQCSDLCLRPIQAFHSIACEQAHWWIELVHRL